MANEDDAYRFLIAGGSFLSFFITLRGLLALSSRVQGLTVNIKVISGLFFTALLVEHIVFSFTGIRPASYIVITGILAVLYILISYILMRALRRA